MKIHFRIPYPVCKRVNNFNCSLLWISSIYMNDTSRTHKIHIQSSSQDRTNDNNQRRLEQIYKWMNVSSWWSKLEYSSERVPNSLCDVYSISKTLVHDTKSTEDFAMPSWIIHIHYITNSSQKFKLYCFKWTILWDIWILSGLEVHISKHKILFIHLLFTQICLFTRFLS